MNLYRNTSFKVVEGREEKMRISGLVRAILVSTVTALLVVYFILLVLRLDRITMLTFYTISTPALIAYGLSFFYFGFMSFMLLTGGSSYSRGLIFVALTFLAIGSFWTTLWLAAKFETDVNLTHLQALLPFLISALIAAAIFVIALRYETYYFRSYQKIQQDLKRLQKGG